eukprot:1142473-Pelagomonas_calceolata.AAC.14
MAPGYARMQIIIHAFQMLQHWSSRTTPWRQSCSLVKRGTPRVDELVQYSEGDRRGGQAAHRRVSTHSSLKRKRCST